SQRQYQQPSPWPDPVHFARNLSRNCLIVRRLSLLYENEHDARVKCRSVQNPPNFWRFTWLRVKILARQVRFWPRKTILVGAGSRFLRVFGPHAIAAFKTETNVPLQHMGPRTQCQF